MNTDSLDGTLLIVDDTPENIKVLFKFLRDAGFKVLVAQDGEDGLRKAEQALPDLILLDVMMPKMNGFEACQLFKSKESLKDIPIIFMTALTDTTDKIRGFNVGAADYITKPIQQEEVLARVMAHLKLYKLQRQLQHKNQQLQERTEELQSEIRYRKEIQISLETANITLAQRTVELQKRTQELEQRNLELDAFAHTVAHDLKNPLSGVIGLSEILLEKCIVNKPIDAKSLDRLQKINDAAMQILGIINAILLLAGVSRHQTVHIETVDMKSLVEQVINTRLSHLIHQYAATIVLPETLPMSLGYTPWLEEVWVNYLTNGMKYGGEVPFLEISAEPIDGNRVKYSIKDNGAGIPVAQQNQLFTPFIRLHTKRADGHGLGLSIVKQIVEKLGGQVGVESELGMGSTFFFTLPCLE
jgi:signal transduction histidine kinase